MCLQMKRQLDQLQFSKWTTTTLNFMKKQPRCFAENVLNVAAVSHFTEQHNMAGAKMIHVIKDYKVRSCGAVRAAGTYISEYIDAYLQDFKTLLHGNKENETTENENKENENKENELEEYVAFLCVGDL